MVVAYSIMGGFIFKALEAPHEEQVKHEVIEFKQDLIEKIWQQAKLINGSDIDHDVFVKKVSEIFVNVSLYVHHLAPILKKKTSSIFGTNTWSVWQPKKDHEN